MMRGYLKCSSAFFALPFGIPLREGEKERSWRLNNRDFQARNDAFDVYVYVHTHTHTYFEWSVLDLNGKTAFIQKENRKGML